MMQLEPALIVDLLQESMRNGKHPFLTVISDSMAPLLKSGDQVQIAAAHLEVLRPGDLVVVIGLTDLMTHRYWGFVSIDNETLLITKGDRPQHFDQPHDIDTLIGMVVSRRRERRKFPVDRGIGKWLNRQLFSLARLDARLFAKRIQGVDGAVNNIHAQDGIFADSDHNNLLHRMLRRSIYELERFLVVVTQRMGESHGDD